MAFTKNGRKIVPRTELTFPGIVPGNDPLKMYRKFLESNADWGMADMEDACKHEYKGKPVREAIVQALHDHDFKDKIITFRPNNLRSPWHREDLEFIIKNAKGKFDGIVLPKIESPEDLQKSLNIIQEACKWQDMPQVEILIENPKALDCMSELCKIGTSPQYGGMLVGLIFGIADYAASNGQPPETTRGVEQNMHYLYPKQRVIATAHAYGLHAIDNVWLDINKKMPKKEEWVKENESKLIAQYGHLFIPRNNNNLNDILALDRFSDLSGREKAAHAAYEDAVAGWKKECDLNDKGLYDKNHQFAQWGGDGSWVIYPGHIDIVNGAFTPTKKQIEDADSYVDQYFAAGGGSMAVTMRGKQEMADTATMNIMMRQLGRAVQAGLFDAEKFELYNSLITEVLGFHY